jgi:hypothetical protein
MSDDKKLTAYEQAGLDSMDVGIRDIVYLLRKNGVDTFGSCEGSPGHGYYWPTVSFRGSQEEGMRALSVAIDNKLPVWQLNRTWLVSNGCVNTHVDWEMIFEPPEDWPGWKARNSSLKYVEMETSIAPGLETAGEM